MSELLRVRTGPPDFHGWNWISKLIGGGCGRAFFLSRVLGIRPLLEFTRGRTRGALCHAGTAQAWEDRLVPDRIREAIDLAAATMTDDHMAEVCDEAEKISTRWCSTWATRPRLELLATEYETGARIGPVGSILDHVVKDPDHGFWVLEKKFEARPIAEGFRFWRRHGQGLLQMAVINEVETSKWGPLRGMIWDLTNTQGGGREFERYEVPLEDVWHAIRPGGWFLRSLATAIILAEQIETGKYEPLAEPVCTLHRFACEFEPLCFTGEAARGRFVSPGGSNLATVTPPFPKGWTPPWEVG